MPPGGCILRSTLFGRVHVPEPPSSLRRLHWHDGGDLKPAAHPPPIPVLDQEDLLGQGIRVSRLVPGAQDVDALGSCVANAATAALSSVLPPGRREAFGITGDAVKDEELAIVLYHDLTVTTGDPAREFPPEDCGSSGLAACQFLERQGVISGHEIAHGAENILSLMQRGPLITGSPWFRSWMEPAQGGWIDGDGSPGALQGAIATGLAGNHETCWYAVERVAYDHGGLIDPQRTIIRGRNSWSASWGDAGDYLAHLSTFTWLAAYCDHRLLVP